MTYKFWKMCIVSDTPRMIANIIGNTRLGLYRLRLVCRHCESSIRRERFRSNKRYAWQSQGTGIAEQAKERTEEDAFYNILLISLERLSHSITGVILLIALPELMNLDAYSAGLV